MRSPAMIKPSPRRSTPFIINQTKRGISSRDASFLVCKVPTGTNCAQIVRPLNVRPNVLFYFIRYDRRNSGASRGIRTLDTWFRRPGDIFSSRGRLTIREYRHLTCGEAATRDLSPSYQSTHSSFLPPSFGRRCPEGAEVGSRSGIFTRGDANPASLRSSAPSRGRGENDS